MILNLIKFPIWENDNKPSVKLKDFQKKQIKVFLSKVRSGEYQYTENQCLCGNKDPSKDIIITKKDRYGIPCINIICSNCSLIRVKERLDQKSTIEFYNNEYRDIYVGNSSATSNFFEEQFRRGEKFKSIVKEYGTYENIYTVFEIGCGAGGILFSFLNDGKKVSGCDYGEKYLDFGKDKGIDLYGGEINESKTPKRSQDLIILSHLLEHINEPINFLNNVLEFISDEKYLLVEVPGVFDIKKTYFNPILYFQNAHVYSFHYSYLNVLFKTLGLNIIYGDERCTFLVQKPKNWKKNKVEIIYDSKLNSLTQKIKREILKDKILYSLFLHPRRIRNYISSLLRFFRHLK